MYTLGYASQVEHERCIYAFMLHKMHACIFKYGVEQKTFSFLLSTVRMLRCYNIIRLARYIHILISFHMRAWKRSTNSFSSNRFWRFLFCSHIHVSSWWLSLSFSLDHIFMHGKANYCVRAREFHLVHLIISNLFFTSIFICIFSLSYAQTLKFELKVALILSI